MHLPPILSDRLFLLVPQSFLQLSLNHASCVITTSGVFSFLAALLLEARACNRKTSSRVYSRHSNQTKRNHDSISTSPMPLPQTTAITCLSEPAATNQLATLSQDQQAKRTRHTQDTLPSTRKRTCSQTESQQHSPLTQIIDIVALSSQIVIQPTEQSTNSQPNKCTTRSQITSHNHHATQASRQ